MWRSRKCINAQNIIWIIGSNKFDTKKRGAGVGAKPMVHVYMHHATADAFYFFVRDLWNYYMKLLGISD